MIIPYTNRLSVVRINIAQVDVSMNANAQLCISNPMSRVIADRLDLKWPGLLLFLYIFISNGNRAVMALTPLSKLSLVMFQREPIKPLK